jgi:hypothetical protein
MGPQGKPDTVARFSTVQTGLVTGAAHTGENAQISSASGTSAAHAGLVALAVLVVLTLFIAPSGLWPWDHDEVHSLVELGLVPFDRFPGPLGQLERMHRLVPVWHFLQNAALSVLPHNEWGTRLLASTCGALVVILSFLAGLRARGAWFGWSLLVLMAGSQTLLWLSQQNRFYSLALLWTTLALLFVWMPDQRRRYDVLAGLCAGAAVLTHNLTLVVFALGAAAAIATWPFGSMPRSAARRALVTAVVTAAIYVAYLRPLLTGWMSGDTGGTPSLVSFVAQVGIVPVALAVFGSVATITRAELRAFHWWLALLVLSLVFVATTPWTLGNWNPRYGLFFMVPVWVMGAVGSAAIAEALASSTLSVAWLVAVCVLLMPKLASHFVDGSRHDLRTAAHIVAGRAPADPVLSNWPADLQYYLEPLTGQHPRYWAPGQAFPVNNAVVVIGSNTWEPPLRIDGRSVTVIGRVGRRRFDEQSHVVMVYLVSSPR